MIAVPDDPGDLDVEEVDLESLRVSYLRRALRGAAAADLDEADLAFLAEETRLPPDDVVRLLEREVVRT